MLAYVELMQPFPQVVNVVEVKYQGEGHLEEAWCRDDGCADSQPLGHVIKFALGCCELLTLGRV